MKKRPIYGRSGLTCRMLIYNTLLSLYHWKLVKSVRGPDFPKFYNYCSVFCSFPCIFKDTCLLPFGYGAYLYACADEANGEGIDPRFCRRFIPSWRGLLQACIAAPPLKVRNLRLALATVGRSIESLLHAQASPLRSERLRRRAGSGLCPAHNKRTHWIFNSLCFLIASEFD